MEKKYYEVVSIADELPSEEGYYRTEGEVWQAYWHNDKKCWDKNPEITHWLRPVSGTLLSVERYEALMKCVEALEQIRTIEASNNERWSYEAMNICEQSLQTLKQTNNE